MKLLFIVAGVLALLILGPLVTIWSLNTLFPVLNIPYNFETWVAAAVLTSLFAARVKN